MHTALHIQSHSFEAVMEFLQNYLTYACRPRVVRRTKARSCGTLYGKDFLTSSDPPRMFAGASDQPGWITVHYNSRREMHELARDLSRAFDCVVVLVLGHEAAHSFYIGVYQAGVDLRTLHFADGVWIRCEGMALPFEPYLGNPGGVEKKGPPFHEFGRLEVIDYCTRLGLLLWANPSEHAEWAIVRV